ncbi:MurR/RpiR family transcriptional regulator [Tissierella sp. Yu-01]|uniref:MurR/RpiR family transcriptional regulator n=1 Tax=Tissierella sp. Yu-01 TaxID=3035694 RepID=UPI00240E120C|nr:MurR/RpiR family transcriptional regulator [Tissierella sp. Yu-01]WFA09719.1 MurR/RpiR family transcriptional regulator [Tissierella sp. Yu-01]
MTRNPNIINNIQINFTRMSKGQKIIAEYIINNYDKAAFMTAASLGSIINVSESTVVRFANTLGYTGYKELQRELQEVIKNKLTTVQRLSLAEDFTSNDNSLFKIMQSDIDNIKKTIAEIDMNSLHKAANLLVNGNRIYVIGLRSSAFLAGYLCFYLNFLFANVKQVTAGPNDVFEQLLKAGENDVVIGITFPRYSKKTLEALDYAKSKKCSIISITDSLLSPATGISDLNLIARMDMISFIDSLVAPMSLINAFIIALANEMKKDINSYFEELEYIWDRYNIYDENNNIES